MEWQCQCSRAPFFCCATQLASNPTSFYQRLIKPVVSIVLSKTVAKAAARISIASLLPNKIFQH